jgi:hypothetical protein
MVRKSLLFVLFALALLAALPGMAQDPFGNAFNHYKCYNIYYYTPFQPQPIKLRDQFGFTTGRAVVPRLLCNPVSKNDEPVPNPEVHLVCYEILEDNPLPPHGVETYDQWGKLQLKVDKAPYLCNPARKVELPWIDSVGLDPVPDK